MYVRSHFVRSRALAVVGSVGICEDNAESRRDAAVEDVETRMSIKSGE